MMINKQVWFPEIYKSEVREFAAEKRIGKIVIQSQYSLISNGTEKLVLSGKIPTELHKVMTVPFMYGSFNFPISYGYSLVGKVVSGSERLLGKSVHLMHPHHSYCFPLDAKSLFVIPTNIKLEDAALASNIETAITAHWDAQLKKDEQILIVGFGLIGQLLAKTLSYFGYDAAIYDPQKEKEIELLGFKRHSNTVSYSTAFHCSATQEGLQFCIDNTGMEAKIIDLSWYGNKSVELKLGTSFHYQRKKIISSQVSHIPGHLSKKWTYLSRKKLVFKLLQEGVFSDIPREIISLENAPKHYQQLLQKPVSTTIIKY